MRRRVVLGLAALAAAGVLAGCGGSEDAKAPAKDTAVPAAIPVANPGGPTQAQLEYREELLRQLESGTYGDCDCTSDHRAKERVADGRAEPPPADQLLSSQPQP